MKRIGKTNTIELWLDGGVTYIKSGGNWNRLFNDYLCDTDYINKNYIKQNKFKLIGRDREWEYYKLKWIDEIYVKQFLASDKVVRYDMSFWNIMKVEPLDKGESNCRMNQKRDRELKLMDVKCDKYRGIKTCR